MNRISIHVRAPRLLLAGALFAALSFTGVVLAQDAAKDDTPHTWEFQRKKGDTAKYRQKIAINGMLAGGTEIKVEVKTLNKQTVEEVTDTGDATVVTTTESRSVTFNGNPIPDDNEHPKVTQTLSKNGLVLKYTLEKGPEGQEKLSLLGAVLSATPTPDKPVKVGDSWKTDIDNRLVTGKKVTVESTFVGTEKVLNTDALKIRIKMNVPTKADADDKATVKMDGFYYLDPKTGRLIRTQYTAENVPLETPDGQSFTVSTTFNNDLIVSGVNDKEEDATKDEKKDGAAKP